MGDISKVGSFALDPLGLGLGDKVFGIDDKKKDPVATQTQEQKAPDSPEGPQADVNAQLIQNQGADRRRRLLSQSTGRPSPTGPSITTNNNRTLF